MREYYYKTGDSVGKMMYVTKNRTMAIECPRCKYPYAKALWGIVRNDPGGFEKPTKNIEPNEFMYKLIGVSCDKCINMAQFKSRCVLEKIIDDYS